MVGQTFVSDFLLPHLAGSPPAAKRKVGPACLVTCVVSVAPVLAPVAKTVASMELSHPRPVCEQALASKETAISIVKPRCCQVTHRLM